jgi:GAF domain-containing protein
LLKFTLESQIVFDFDELSKRITDLIRDSFGFYYVGIFTIGSNRSTLQLRASSASPKVNKSQIARLFTVDFSVGEGIIGQAALRGMDVYSPDVTHDPVFRFLEAIPEPGESRKREVIWMSSLNLMNLLAFLSL